ncbi:hypothetical protein [Halobacterium wangiae]|uniref:hypothetical protein n=1 Tax=Halobacterium wangiae TaxID=2902623 RepID=UPI001E3B561E|nr:hypothetical protein [Halobacterium wangiae]
MNSVDNKKRAQAAWAVLLALLALLFVPQVPNLPRNNNPSESPAEDPAPDESGEENQNQNEDGSEDGAEDGAEDPSGDGSDEGWFQDDPETIGDPDAPTGTPDSGGHAPAPEDGQGWEAPEDYGDGTDGGTYGDIIDDLLDEYPSATAAPSWLAPFFDGSSDGETTYGNDATTPDLPDNPLDGLPGHSDPQSGGVGSIPGYAEGAIGDDPSEGLTWAGKMAGDVIEEAAKNPEPVLIVVGAVGGAFLISGGAVTAVTTGVATRLAAAGATRKQVQDAEAFVQELAGSGGDAEDVQGDDGDDSGTAAPSDEPWSPAPGDDPGDEDDIANPDEGEGGHLPAPSDGVGWEAPEDVEAPEPAMPGYDDDGQHESIGRGSQPGYGL